MKIIQNTFIYLIQNYPHIRPIWQFSRIINDSNSNWVDELSNVLEFRF